MSFEILEHPADIGFRAYAASLPQLFAECAHALISLILDSSDIEPRQQLTLGVEGQDYESLLVNWLNEVLYSTDSQRLALGRFDITVLDETHLECTAFGEQRDPRKHPAKLIVKAVTYHQLRITHTVENWTADVYVDV